VRIVVERGEEERRKRGEDKGEEMVS